MNFQTINRQRKFILLASTVGLIAMFLPWVTVSAENLFGTLDGGHDTPAMSLTQNGMHGSGIIVFLTYICAAALSLLGDQTRTLGKSGWLATMAAASVAILFTIILLTNTPTGSMGFAKSSVGYGAWISGLASMSVLASAWLLPTPGYTLKDSFDQLKKGTMPILLLVLITSLFYGCSKSNSNSTAASSTSQWTLNGTTYKGVTTGYNDTTTGLGILVSVDAKGDYLSVIFYSHPLASGTYIVTDGSPASNTVQIQMYVYSGGAGQIYTSTGKTGDQLDLTVSGGKIKVSFTDITLASGATTVTGSGTALQP
jgi:hypothetical protein